jgi:prephenate dehydratase
LFPFTLSGSMRIAYHGVAGSYGHLAARTTYPAGNFLGFADVTGVLRAVTRGAADIGIVPVANSIIGAVAAGVQASTSPGVTIVSEIELPIRHCLLALAGSAPSGLRTVESHPAALQQCARFIASRSLAVRTASSTAHAARTISTDRNFSCAAIAGEDAAEIYGLAILERDIADAVDNRTRFAVLARAG